MHYSLDIEDEGEGWKNNWFVKNVLSEIPIVGAFFRTGTITCAIRQAFKSTVMIVGGSVGMMLHILKIENTDTMGVRMTKDTVNMAIGMMAGNVAYNALISLASSIYKCQCHHSQPTTSDLELSSRTDYLGEDTLLLKEMPKSHFVQNNLEEATNEPHIK